MLTGLLKNKNFYLYLGLGIFSCILVSIFPFFIRGLFAPYWDVADADSIYIGQATLLNAKFGQQYFDHTGYLYILLLSWWLKISYWLGFVPKPHVWSLLESGQFADQYRAFTTSARILAFTLSSVFCMGFGVAIWKLIKSLPIALATIALLALSQANGIHAIQIRAELLCAGLFFIALILAAKDNLKLSYYFTIGFCCYGSTMAKIQTIPAILMLISALPFLFSSVSSQEDRWLQKILKIKDIKPKIFRVSILIASGIFFHFLYWNGKMIWEEPKAYHGLIWGFILGLYLLRNRRVELFTMSLGAAFAFTFHSFAFRENNVRAISHFIDHALTYSQKSAETSLLTSVFSHFEDFIFQFSFDQLNQYPFNYLFIAGLFFFLGRIITTKTFPKCEALLILLVIAFEVLFFLRYYSSLYRIFVDPIKVLLFVISGYRLGEALLFKKATVVVLFSSLACITYLDFVKTLDRWRGNTFNACDIRQPSKNFCGQVYYNEPIQNFLRPEDPKEPSRCIDIVTGKTH